MLTYEGCENRDKLIRWLEEQYGKLGPGERKMLRQVEWHGERMTIALTYDIGTGGGSLLFISPALNHLLNESIASLPD